MRAGGLRRVTEENATVQRFPDAQVAHTTFRFLASPLVCVSWVQAEVGDPGVLIRYLMGTRAVPTVHGAAVGNCSGQRLWQDEPLEPRVRELKGAHGQLLPRALGQGSISGETEGILEGSESCA